MHSSSWVIAFAILCFIAVDEVHSWGSEPDLTKYDPFKPKCKLVEGEMESDSCWGKDSKPNVVQEEGTKVNYKTKLKWNHSFFDDMTASIARFDTKVRNLRVVVFSVRGVVLSGSDVSDYNKDGRYQDLQILFIDGSLWVYPFMRITPDSNSDRVIVVRQEEEKDKKKICRKKVYNIPSKSSKTVEEPANVQVFEDNWDEDCKALTKGESGPFTVTSILINPNEKVNNVWAINQINNFGIKFLKYTTPFCHEKVVLSWNGTPLTGTAIFCGKDGSETDGLVVTKRGVYYEKHIVARFSPSDSKEITVFLNPRDGGCIKYQFTTTLANGPQVIKKSKSIMKEIDQECRDFKEGKLITSEQINQEWKASVIKSLQTDQVNVVPYNIDSFKFGPQLPVYDLDTRHIYAEINTGKEMGVFITLRSNFWVYLVAKGVIIDVAVLSKLPKLVVEDDKIIYEKELLFMRDKKDENLFTVYFVWDQRYCSRTRYVLVNKGGKLQKQELFPAHIGVYDSTCSGLVKQELRRVSGNNQDQDYPEKESLEALLEKTYEAVLVDYI